MKKFDLKRLKKKFNKSYAVDPQGWNKEDIKALLCESLDAEEFEERGYRFGTPQECWDAIFALGECLESDKQVPPSISLWFLNSLNGLEKEDPKELLRQLGLVEMGRTRQFNRFDICERMIELVEGEGMVKAEASRKAAAEFGCHPETCLMWYRRKSEIFTNK